ncbi:hypothetical protein [Pontibacter mangrovi]|uniref:Uncharacterized protein n=1 Tax=Pontibacter mangrovi TaxID=2589816 RepID=A0A501WCF1_9BACT|nr:hypothetical protein [Pontibacter mangrovi]TPE44507.1 hypothetical protein FJM65_10235 [Pontibacter mangrovi]
MSRQTALLFLSAVIITSCVDYQEEKPSAKDERTKLEVQTVPVRLSKPAVVIFEMDSLEIEQLKEADGEDIFYTAADDLMWYNYQLQQKMDSLAIPMMYTEDDTLKVITPNQTYEIVKDSTFTVYTYFYYDGEDLTRVDLFDLLDN